MPQITVVIPNYNGLKFMEPCMAALSCQSFTDFCVLIVDNGSTDGSVSYIKKLCEASTACIPVHAVCLSENTGFSGAANVGITAADTPYVVLLNNDTEPEADYLLSLYETMETANYSGSHSNSNAGFASHSDTGFRSHSGADFSHASASVSNKTDSNLFALSPKMVQLYHKELLDDAGDGYNLLGWAFQRGVGQSVSLEKFNRPARIFSACAGAAIYRKALLEEIKFDTALRFEASYVSEGLKSAPWLMQQPLSEAIYTIAANEYFDQQHFAYLEDLDLSYRARKQGFDIRYCPEAVVYHVGSGTSGSKYNSFKVRLAARNNVYLNYKNMPLLQLLINLPGILLGVLIKQLFFLKCGFGKDYFGGFLEGLKTLKHCKKTKFKFSQLSACIVIEAMLLEDTFSYAADFISRRLSKRRTS